MLHIFNYASPSPIYKYNESDVRYIPNLKLTSAESNLMIIFWQNMNIFIAKINGKCNHQELLVEEDIYLLNDDSLSFLLQSGIR